MVGVSGGSDTPFKFYFIFRLVGAIATLAVVERSVHAISLRLFALLNAIVGHLAPIFVLLLSRKDREQACICDTLWENLVHSILVQGDPPKRHP